MPRKILLACSAVAALVGLLAVLLCIHRTRAQGSIEGLHQFRLTL